MTNRLYRSRTNKVFGGVCGGLAEYFEVDPVVLRILFVLLVIFGGTGVLLYVAAVIIIPKKPLFEMESMPEQNAATDNRNVRNWFGYALIGFGALLLLANLNVFHFFSFIGDTVEYIFPVMLIILGMAIIYYHQTKPDTAETPEGSESNEQNAGNAPYKQFRRSSTDKKILGVCGGLADYFGIDPSMMRLLYVILCLASFGAGLVLYLLLAIIVPDDRAYNATRF